MQTALPSRCVGSVVCLDQRLSTAIKPVEELSMKRMSKNSRTLSRHSTFKPSLGIEKYYGETSKRTSAVNATRFPDKGGEGITEKRMSGGSYNILSVFAGMIFNMIKGVMKFLSLEKKYFGKIEDKIENAANVVEEVADTVEEVAKFTEDIAEKVEQHSKMVAAVHETAAFVDNISEKVDKEAEIVENEADQIKKSLKSIGTDMEAAEHALEDIEDRVSKEIVNGDERSIGTQNLRDPEVVAKNQ